MIDIYTLSLKLLVFETDEPAVPEDANRRDSVSPVSGVEIRNVRSRCPALEAAFVLRPFVNTNAFVHGLEARIRFKPAVGVIRFIGLAAVKCGIRCDAERTHVVEFLRSCKVDVLQVPYVRVEFDHGSTKVTILKHHRARA